MGELEYECQKYPRQIVPIYCTDFNKCIVPVSALLDVEHFSERDI